jgi:hypothetical protein
VVNHGSTFTELLALLRRWIDEEHAQIDVIKRKIRFVGITVRRKTSPNAYGGNRKPSGRASYRPMQSSTRPSTARPGRTSATTRPS